MDDTSKDGQSSSRKTPEEIRAERIAEIRDPKLRQKLEGIANTRDAELAQARESQLQNYDKRVAELRDQKIRSANAPQLIPPGMRSPYLGEDGHARAGIDAKAQIQTQNHDYLKKLAKDHNDQIDKRLDAQRENQAGRDLSRLQPPGAELERDSVTPLSRAPNRYAELISQQNYAERAKQAELDREKEQDPARQQQRQRGLQR